MDTDRARTGRSTAELEAGVDDVRRSPRDRGTLELIVVRPAVDERVVLGEARFDLELGVVGDTWSERPTSTSPTPNPEAQVTLMNSRAAALIAGDRDRWPLAGDQLYVDLDLSGEHLPPGSRLQIGTAVLEVSAKPHTGCAKFSARFGSDAWAFLRSDAGRELNLRGINARVVEPGVAQTGSVITNLVR
jgi:hypothetical protein